MTSVVARASTFQASHKSRTFAQDADAFLRCVVDQVRRPHLDAVPGAGVSLKHPRGGGVPRTGNQRSALSGDRATSSASAAARPVSAPSTRTTSASASFAGFAISATRHAAIGWALSLMRCATLCRNAQRLCRGVCAHDTCAACAPSYAASTSAMVQPGEGTKAAQGAVRCAKLTVGDQEVPRHYTSAGCAAPSTHSTCDARALHFERGAALARVADARQVAACAAPPHSVVQVFQHIGACSSVEHVIVEAHGAESQAHPFAGGPLPWQPLPRGTPPRPLDKRMASPRASLVADVKASLGESPVWHERTRTVRALGILLPQERGRWHGPGARLASRRLTRVTLSSSQLFHVDINGKTVYATRGAETTTVATLPSQVGCVVPRASGGLLACLERDVRHIDVGTGAVSSGLVAVPEDHCAWTLCLSSSVCASLTDGCLLCPQ